MPQVAAVREIEVLDGKVRAVRDLEDALEVLEVDLPAVLAVTSELNTPRLPPLSAILKAGRKPLHTWGPQDVGVTANEVGAAASAVEVLSNLAPVQDRKGIMVEDEAELIKALQQQGVLEQ